jgi:hypothetical protein
MAGSGVGSVSQRYGSEGSHPDQNQNVMDPEHCLLEYTKPWGPYMNGRYRIVYIAFLFTTVVYILVENGYFFPPPLGNLYFFPKKTA